MHPCGGAGAEVAVLICGALSREALDAHHSLRVLASDFAAAGYPTMRFDYSGQGDSSDILGNDAVCGQHWLIWQRNINEAADRLRRITGARRLILCGIRIGATLAVLTAERRSDIAGLILLAPVMRGRSYLRQLQVQGALQHDKAASKAAGLEFQELRLDQQAIEMINDVDLRQSKLKQGVKVAIFHEPSSRLIAETLAAWERLGAATECHPFGGLEPLTCSDTQGYKVPADSRPIIDWMRRVIPNEARPAHAAMRQAAMRQGDATLRLHGCMETPLRFGPDDRLFGILCQPETGPSGVAVIIVNTGRNPHSGLGRFGVEFARRMAASGITSLRMDFAGLGDSIGAPPEKNMRSDVFEDDRLMDVSAAITALEERGFCNFTVHGVCSGAYHALHAAARDSRIKALLLVNLPLFCWRNGDLIADSKQRSYALGHYAKKLREGKRWGRLLSGKSDLVGIMTGQILRLAKRVRLAVVADEASELTDPRLFARKIMGRLADRQTRTLFLYDPDNPGAYEIESLFGKGGSGLKAFTGTQVQMIPRLGEALAEAYGRTTAAERMMTFLADTR